MRNSVIRKEPFIKYVRMEIGRKGAYFYCILILFLLVTCVLCRKGVKKSENNAYVLNECFQISFSIIGVQSEHDF